MYKLNKFVSENYCEEGQALSIKFSLAKTTKESVDMLHGLIKCRDFLCDVCFAEYTKTDKGIYGFNWKGDGKITSGKKLKMLVMIGDDKHAEHLVNNISNLQLFETLCGLTPSTLEPVETSKDGKWFLVTSSIAWTYSSTLLVLYSLLLKLCAFPTGEHKDVSDWLNYVATKLNNSAYHREVQYVKEILGAVDASELFRAVTDREKIFGSNRAGCDVKTSMSAVHHHQGPVSFFTSVAQYKKHGEIGDISPSIREWVGNFCE